MVYNNEQVVSYANFRLSRHAEVMQVLGDRGTFSNCCYCIANAWKIHKIQNIELNEALQISINDFLNQGF
jgi:hypothetical protein